MINWKTFSTQLEQLETHQEKGDDITERVDVLRNEATAKIDELRDMQNSVNDDPNLVCAHAKTIEMSFKLDDLPMSKDTPDELIEFKEKIKNRIIDHDLDTTINSFVKDVSDRLKRTKTNRDNQAKNVNSLNRQVELLSALASAMDDLAKFHPE